MTTAEPQTAPALELGRRLRARLRDLDTVLIALSGGVDSSVVAALAAGELGDRALAVTGVSPSLPSHELPRIEAFCARLGLAHLVIHTHELEVPGYVANSPERCYYCKDELFAKLTAVAQERGIGAVADGTTAEDLTGHRPGRRAALERKVLSPLVEAGATKAQVRALARELDLEVADRPASPCLSSRIAYGTPVTAERLAQIGQAEAFLRELGFTELRVRAHEAIARVEVPTAQISAVADKAALIQERLKQLGFVYVTLDLGGLRSGSLLEVLPEERR